MYLSHPQDSSKSRPRRKPLRSVKELAVEFGITPHSLAAYLQASHLRPEMVSTAAIKNTWYVPGPVRAWWKAKTPVSQP